MDTATVRRSHGFGVVVSAGLASYGVMHIVLAGIALQVAFGQRGDASSQGALRALADQPLGGALLWVVAVGMVALTAWQVIEAVINRPEDREEMIKRRARAVGRALVYLALAGVAAGIAMGDAPRSGEAQETLSARLLRLPAGWLLVVAVSLGTAAVAVSHIVKGIRRKFREDLATSVSRSVEIFGMVGYIAKGVALLIIAVLFVLAAVSADPDKAGGMDAALSTIRDQPFGSILLVLMALGIACFGLFCLAWARSPRR